MLPLEVLLLLPEGVLEEEGEEGGERDMGAMGATKAVAYDFSRAGALGTDS